MATSLARYLRSRLEFKTRFNPAFENNQGRSEEISVPHKRNNLEKDRAREGLFALETNPVHSRYGSQPSDVQSSHRPKPETAKLTSINSIKSIKVVTPRPID